MEQLTRPMQVVAIKMTCVEALVVKVLHEFGSHEAGGQAEMVNCVWGGGGCCCLEQGNGLDSSCLEGAVGSTKCPSKTSERALKERVYLSLCVCVSKTVQYLTHFMLNHTFLR